MGAQNSEGKIWWSNIVFFTAAHIAALIGLYYRPISVVPRATLILAAIRWQIAQFGITIGYHRMYSHRAFQANLGVRIGLAAMGTSAFQGSIKWWCLRHRLHHRFTDDPMNDPYAATKGLLYSHVGWFFVKRRYERMDSIGQQDLASDPVVQFQHKYYVPLALSIGLALPTLVGACWNDVLGSFVYAGLVTLVINWHCTFFVNSLVCLLSLGEHIMIAFGTSLAHWNGVQPYSDENTSRGNLMLAMLTSGEGNHNFHTFPFDYRSEPSWLAWDPSKWVITLLWYLGLVRSLRKASDAEIQYSVKCMESKKDDRGPVDDVRLECWSVDEVFDYITEEKERCVMVINGYVVDATKYMAAHPGGPDVLRKYRVPPQDTLEDTNEWRNASWAFNGGLNKHSRIAHRQLRELAIGRLVDLS